MSERNPCMNLRGVYKAMKYKIAIFDLDGTILNTLADLTGSVNFALEKRADFPVRQGRSTAFSRKRSSCSDGKKPAKRRIGRRKRRAVSVFNDYYAVHCNDTTGAYRGIPETVCRLRKKGICTAVVSISRTMR